MAFTPLSMPCAWLLKTVCRSVSVTLCSAPLLLQPKHMRRSCSNTWRCLSCRRTRLWTAQGWREIYNSSRVDRAARQRYLLAAAAYSRATQGAFPTMDKDCFASTCWRTWRSGWSWGERERGVSLPFEGSQRGEHTLCSRHCSVLVLNPSSPFLTI